MLPSEVERCTLELGVLGMGAHNTSPGAADCPTPEALRLHVVFTQLPDRRGSDFQRKLLLRFSNLEATGRKSMSSLHRVHMKMK